MSKTVVLPNGLEVAFPNNATDAEMARAITDAMYASEKVVPTVEVAQPKATGKFFKSIPRGIDQVQGSIGSALDVIGEATGLQSLEKYGEKVKERNALQIAEKEARNPRLDLKDVKNVVRGQQSFVDYMQQGLGEVLPSMGLSVGGGYLGGKAGAGLGAKLGLTATVAIPLPGARVIGVGVGALIGGAIGAFLPSFLMGTGSAQDRIKELDPDARNPWAALGGGAVIGALDVASLAVPVFYSMKKGIPKNIILKGLIKGGVKEGTAKGAIATANKSLTQALKTVKGRLPKGRLGKGLAVGVTGMGTEAFTERLQELTAIEVAEAVTDKEVMDRAEALLEATVMGAIAGAGFGGGAGVITGKNYGKETPPPVVERGAYDEIILSAGIPDPTADLQAILNTEIAAQPEDIIRAEVTGVNQPDGTMGDILLGKPVIKDTKKVYSYDSFLYKNKEVTVDKNPTVLFGDTSDIQNQIEINRNEVELKTSIDEARSRIIRGDQKAIQKTVNSKPVVFMKAIITGDINYSNKDNKSQSKKAFAERIGKADIKDKRTVNTIFNALVNKGEIEKVGPSRWKYTDKSLNNKELKAVAGRDTRSLKISEESEVNGNKEEWKISLNDKDISVVKETKEVKIPGAPAPVAEPTKKQVASEKRIQKDVENVYENLSLIAATEGSYEGTYLGKQFQVLESKSPSGQFVSTIFIEDNAGNLREVEGAFEIYVARDADKALKKQLNKVVTSLSGGVQDAVADFRDEEVETEVETQTRWIVRGPSKKGGIKNIRNDGAFSVQTLSDEAQLESIKEQVLGYVDEEFVGLRASNRSMDMRFPVGLLLEEQFQVDALSKGILNKSGKPYTSLQGMMTDVKHYTKQIADIDENIQDKQLEATNFRDEPSTVKIIEEEIKDLQSIKETKVESLKLLNDFLTGRDPVSAIGRTPTQKELRKLLTPKQEAQVVKEEAVLKKAVFNSKLYTGDGSPVSIEGRAEAQKLIISDMKNKALTHEEAMKKGMANVNFYNDWLASMHKLANEKPAFLPFHILMRKYDEIFRGITNRTTITASPYAGLTTEQRAKVDRLLMAAMMLSQRPENGSITFPNYYTFQEFGQIKENGEVVTRKSGETEQDFEARIQKVIEANPEYTPAYFQQALDMAAGGKSRNDNTFNFKIGDPVSIEGDVEARALESMYTALNGLWDSYIEASVNATGRVKVSGMSVDPNLNETLEKEIEANEENNVNYPDADPMPTTMGGLLQARADAILGTTTDANKKTVKNDPEKLEANAKKLYNYYDDAAAAIGNMENMKKEGYFPSVREGDGFARIYKVAVDENGNRIKDKEGNDVRGQTYQRIEITVPYWRRVLNNGNFQKSAQTYMNKHYPNWKDDYQKVNASGLSDFDESFEIEFIGKDSVDDNSAADQGFQSIERMLIEQDRLVSKTTDDQGKKTASTVEFEERLMNTFRAYNLSLKNRSFRAHTNRRKGIPGYVTPENMDTYVAEAFGLYTVKAARLVARMSTEDGIRVELLNLKNLADSNNNKPIIGGKSLFQVAEANKDFVFSPQSSAAFFKTVAFNGFLGGNISSLMVNLSQNMVTASFLYGAYGLKGRGSVLGAFADATRMIKAIVLVPQEFIIPPLAPEGRSRDQFTPIEVDGENLYNKWKKFITKEEYRALAEQSAQGAFGKMNTEAIANNSDVTTKFLETKIMGDLLPKGVQKVITKNVSKVSKALTTMYAAGEMINRMTASLAAMRLVKKFGAEELITFTDGIPGQDRLIEANPNDMFEQMVAAGITVSNATQFNLDPFNRSKLSRKLGGVPIQFLGFVTMMIEIYGNVLFGRYGDQELSFMNNRQKQRMLVGLVGQQLALGGLFALPFMDDLDEVVQTLQEATGMTKTSIYEVLYESLIDDAGLDPDTATAILRGPLEGYGPISVGKRIALSPFQNVLNMRFNNIFEVPFKLLGGPSASFIEGWGDRVIGSAREGRWDKVALYFPPTAVTTNLVNAFYNSTEGMQTGTGRQLNDGLDGMDVLWGAIGFTSTNVSTDREQIRRNKYMNSRMRVKRDRYTDRITKATLMLHRETNVDKKQELRNKISELYKEIIQHDAGKEPEDKIDPSYSIGTSVNTRLKQAYSRVPGAIAPVSKALSFRALQLNRKDD